MFKKAIVALGIVGLVACGGNKNVDNLSKPEVKEDKVSYAIGFDIGKKMAGDSIKINYDYFMKGLKDGMTFDTATKKQLLTDKEIEEAFKKLSDEMGEKNKKKMEQEQQKMLKKGEEFKAQGAKFLADNANKPGVKVTPSGLQYRVIKEGTGKKPAKDEMVKVHLIGKFTNGEEFDNTRKREAVDLPIAQLIPGWQEALLMMPEGSVWEVVVPPSLAYGEKGAGMTIPPNATLIFEMELVKVMGKAPKQQGMPGN